MAANDCLNVSGVVEDVPGHRACLVFDGLQQSYSAVREQSAHLRARLSRQGVGRGDRVVLLLPNSPAFVVAYLAVLGLGAVAVCVNPLLTDDEIGFILDDSRAVLVIADDSLRERLMRRRVRLLATEAQDDDAAGGAMPSSVAVVSADDPAVIVYSSGTTARPKGVVLSHGNVAFTARAKVRYLGVTADDRLLLFLPLHHCFGQNAIMNPAFFAGATLVLHRRFEREPVLASMRRDKVSMVFGVPTTYLALQNHVTPADAPCVRYWFSAAAPLPLELEQRWHATMGLPIHQGYGQTECSPFATYNHDRSVRPGTVGTVIDGVELRIVDPMDGRELAVGEPGEIVLRGPNVMLGYWNRPQETAGTIRDGWLHTGDIGRLDADGYLSIEDRLTDLIIVGGRNVYPAEVENTLYGHPAVAEAAVYGVADPFLGEEVWASVVVRPDRAVAAEELEGLCRRTLAAYKVPTFIEFRAALPRNPTGKILKRELRAAAVRPSARREAGTCGRRDLEGWIAAWLARHLNLVAEDIDPSRAFADYGLDSVLGVSLARALADHLRHPLEPTLVWEASTLSALMSRLEAAGTLPSRASAAPLPA